MTALWPGALPDFCQVQGYSEAPRGGVVSFDTDAGLPIERARGTVDLNEIRALMFMTGDQVTLFRDFVKRDLARGVNAFLMMHPRTNSQARFVLSGVPKYAITALGGNQFQISFTLIEIGAP